MAGEPLTTVVRKRFTRRDLMKALPLAGAAAGALAVGLIGARAAATTRNRGTCRFCLMHCGVVTTVQGDRLLKVEGDLAARTRGFVCQHGYALREMVHSHARIRRPLVRKGDAFHEVSWDDALHEVAARLEKVKARWGPEAFAVQTGWPLVRHPLVGFLHRFMRAYGSPNVATVASLCEASLRMGQALTVGSKYSADLRGLKTLVVWGTNPPVTSPPFAHLVAQKALGGNLVVIDPVRTQLATEATEHLQVRPGTDGALALGLINLVVQDGLYDQAFVAAHTVGFEALKALAAEYPVERVEQLTSVPAAQVRKLARLMATERPTAVWQGLGVEHHENGVQTVRAISSLEVLCGRFDGTHDAQSVLTPPGPHFPEEPLPALYRLTTPEPVPPPVRARALGRDEHPLYEMYNREAQGQLIADAVLDDKPYPVRALMLVASNALITGAGSQRYQQAAKKLELLVTVDPFLSFSAQRSDVVLPAATFGEAPDVDDGDEVAQHSLVPPQHQAWPDFKILTHLARAMGLGQYFPWESFAEAQRAPHLPWMLDEASQPKPRPETDAPRFATPSGQAEFTSRLLPEVGQDARPVWTPPSAQPSADFPLRLVTGPRPRAYINSQFHGVPSIEARMREAEVLVHPEAAARFGVTHGQRVKVSSPAGSIVLRLVVTKDVHPECAVMSAGWAEANANVLIETGRRDPVSGFPAFRSGVCRVERA